MTHRQIVSEVESFFTSYREAFERSDAAAVAGHFGESVHVASDIHSGVRVDFMTGAEWRAAIEQLLARYQTLGVKTAEPRRLEVLEISARLAQASLHWALSDRDRALYDFQALYTLASDGTRWRIVAIAHDEFLRSPKR